MIIITETIQVTVPITITTYEASDGKIFETRREFDAHEMSLPLKGYKVIDTAIDVMGDFFTEQPATLYKIENEEDWNLLVERVWIYRQSEKEYPGSGLYFAIREYCGDHPDEYTIYEYDYYMNRLHHYYNEFCNRMEDAYQELNT